MPALLATFVLCSNKTAIGYYSLSASMVGGQIPRIGFLEGQKAHLDLMRIIFRQTSIRGIAVGPANAFPAHERFPESAQDQAR